MPFQRLSSGAIRFVNGKALLLSSTSVPPVVAVTAISLTPATGTANSAAGTVIGTLAATVSNGPLTNPVWTLTGTAGGDFQIVNGNQVAVLPSNVPVGNYTITAQVAASNLATPFSQAVAVTMGAGGTTPDWDTLTPYSQVALGVMNAGSAALTSPFVTTLHRAQRGDIPPGSHIQLFKSDGTAIPTQQDGEAILYADGSLAAATISFFAPDTLAPNGSTGDTANYLIKAVAGAPTRTPKFTLAQFAAANDLRLIIRTNFGNLNDDTSNFQVAFNDAVSAGLYEGSSSGTDHPLTSIRTDRSGQQAPGWTIKGYARRISDGAWHTTLLGTMSVTATGLTNGILVDALLDQFAGIDGGSNPLQTVGPVLTPGGSYPPIHGIVELWNGDPKNGGTRIRTWGGPTDYRAVTFASGAFDTSTGLVTFPPDTSVQRARKSVGYVFQSTGALPGSLAANKPYFVTGSPFISNPYPLYGQRSLSFYNATDNAQQWAANTDFQQWDGYRCMYVGSGPVDQYKTQIYVALQGGTTGSTPPSPAGGSRQQDGTVVWEPANLAFTSPGSGTITAYPVVSIFPACAAALVDDQTSDPVWIGSGPAPRVEVIKDMVYYARYARACPNYIFNQGQTYPNGLTFDGFSASEPYFPAAIDAYGDNPGTNVVGWQNNSAVNAMLQQRNVTVQRHMRGEALGWFDHWSGLRDQRSLMPPVANNGPGNAAGQYSGLGPSINQLWFDFRGIKAGQWVGVGQLIDRNLYDARYSTLLDPSHLPAPWVTPYERTARAIFLDQGIMLANCMSAYYKGDTYTGGITGTSTINGRTYCNTVLVNPQVRGCGWAVRTLNTLDAVLPAASALRSYWTDMVQDAIDFAIAVIADNQARNPAAYNFGYMRWGSTANGGGIQNWMVGLLMICLAQAAREGRNPGWRTIAEHVANNYYLRWFDITRGGNPGLIDNNNNFNTPIFSVGSDIVAGDVITLMPTGNISSYPPTGSVPPTLNYTVQSGQTPAQVAAAMVALVNSTPSWTSFGYAAVAEGSNQYFRVRMPATLFNKNNANALHQLNNEDVRPTSIGKLTVLTNFTWFSRPDMSGGFRQQFATWDELMEFNLGPNWPQSTVGPVSLVGAQNDFKLPSDGSWDYFSTVNDSLINHDAVGMLSDAGITNAARIYDGVAASIAATGSGGFVFSGYIQNSPSLGVANDNRTYPVWAMKPFAKQ